MRLPKEFELRMQQMLKDEYADFCRSLDETDIAKGVRINTLKNGRDVLLPMMSDKVFWCDDGYYVNDVNLSGKHPYHTAGLFYFQEPSAMSPVEALGIEPGDRVLDLCAAPGGKSTHAAAKLMGEGIIVCNEIIPKRAKILSENIERMGIKNAIVTNEEPERLASRFDGFFNKIIVDAPCSGEGMFRKEPQAVDEWSIEHSEACAVRQKLICDSAIKMLAPGGKLVYSTCTFAPCENEGVAKHIIDTYPDMRLVDIEIDGLSDGCGEWIGDERDFSGTKRIFPHKQKGEGHFVALFEKDGRDECCLKRCCDSIKEFDDFCKENLKITKKGKIYRFGDTVYMLPYDVDVDKLKVLRVGVCLGEMRKGRFLPSHALALALKTDDFRNVVNLTIDDVRVEKYLHGETISADVDGWCAVAVDGFTLGWGKGSCGVVKNHYPKGLRLM